MGARLGISDSSTFEQFLFTSEAFHVFQMNGFVIRSTVILPVEIGADSVFIHIPDDFPIVKSHLFTGDLCALVMEFGVTNRSPNLLEDFNSSGSGACRSSGVVDDSDGSVIRVLRQVVVDIHAFDDQIHVMLTAVGELSVAAHNFGSSGLALEGHEVDLGGGWTAMVFSKVKTAHFLAFSFLIFHHSIEVFEFSADSSRGVGFTTGGTDGSPFSLVSKLNTSSGGGLSVEVHQTHVEFGHVEVVDFDGIECFRRSGEFSCFQSQNFFTLCKLCKPRLNTDSDDSSGERH